MHASPNSGIFRTTILAIWPLLAITPVHAATIYVRPTGSNTKDGLSWATAKGSVQAGLSAAASGDQVWVAMGTYYERITLKTGVALYGGFAGSESDLAQRNWTANPTILDGNRGGSVVTGPTGATTTTRIDGFTIRNGKADAGGGIYSYNSSPTIASNTVIGNSAETGGGIYCGNSAPLIANNAIIGNTATGSSIVSHSGGGIDCLDASPTIVNNTIAGNSAPDGGGIYCMRSSPRISNTIITCNSSGIYVYPASGTPTLRYSCVHANGAYNYSGLTDPTGTNGNISADAKLANLPYANVHIQPGSPCIDAGDDTVVQAAWLDMDGQPRIGGTHVDIGADESDGTNWPDGPNVIVRVRPTGDNANDGSSWALAKRTVQAGINAASGAGGEVWVAAGTYPERITLLSCAHVYGGFAGTETQLSERDWRVHKSVLDGGQSGTVVAASSGQYVSTIDGFVIRNGSGAGVSCSGCAPRIANNTITGNGDSGIYCYHAFPIIAGNTITGNSGMHWGGGIYCQNSSPAIVGNFIANNSVVGPFTTTGGGIYCYQSSPLIANNTITGNNAVSGGGITCYWYAKPTIVNTIIAFNGSGVECRDYSSATLANNCMYGNGCDFIGLPDPIGTNGNIAADPKLAGLRNGHIQPDSPCIDAGDDRVVQSDWRDVDGQSRIAGAHVDIGADESDGTIWPADVNVIIRVSPLGNDINDGSSWSLAKRTVQAGINAAVAGDQVWVATGTYIENLTLRPGVQMCGGFAGSETSLAQRDWAANKTVLDGNKCGSVVKVPIGAAASTRIDGFVIRNGRGTPVSVVVGSMGSSIYSGGGIYCESASPTIVNNTITDNSVIVDTNHARGGAIFCSNGSPIIANNTITGNSASGTSLYGTYYGYGGGIYCSNASPIIANNTIAGNSATYGGAIYGCSNSAGMIVNNTITTNVATGGGIYCDSWSPTIVGTIIAFNASGICSVGSTVPALRHNCVYGNGGANYSGLADSTGTDGNLSVDPGLTDMPYGNVHLLPDSPCVDAGDDAAVLPGWPDMDGQARIAGAHADIGADESDGTIWPSLPGRIVRVSAQGSDANDGSSWAMAKRTVQAGIDTAANAGGGQVWVAAGTYIERVTLRKFVHLYGGFAGTETQCSARDPSAHQSILDGSQGGSVVTLSEVGYTCNTIDGLVIRNGKATSGGGIYCVSCSPTITHNTITGNSGSGIFCNSGVPTIADNTITGNSTSSSGGGICCASAIIVRNTITGNAAATGGGIQCASAMVANNTIIGNTAASHGAALYCIASSCPAITNSTIIGNGASGNGGGIYADASSPTIANNTITHNTAASGGGIQFAGASAPTVVNTIVAFNSSGICQATGTTTPTLRCNCVYGNATYNYSGLPNPTGIDGNLSADPCLAGRSYGNVHLQPGSPCVDGGDDTVVQAGSLDMDGQARVAGRYVDIGADESDGTIWPSGPAIIVRVSPQGDDVNNGSSWLLAKRTVQSAIDAAAAVGGEVWVQEGTYPQRITLRNGAHVFGGFAGTETLRADRDFLACQTILDGSYAGSVVTANAIGSGLATIDGFVIRHGSGTAAGSLFYGGGIYCLRASPTIANNTISANNVYPGSGGAIYCNAAFPVIIGNTITFNNAGQTGATEGQGAGICCTNSSPTIANNTITYNYGYAGGGIGCSNASPTIANNTITNNDASSGGGIGCSNSSPTVANNTITGNSAYFGGGISCSNSSPAIANNTIANNNASSGGGISCVLSCSPTIANTIVACNSSGICRTGSGTVLLRYNCVYDNAYYNYSGLVDPTGTDGNICVDPRFVRPAGAGEDDYWFTADDDPGDFRLLPGSPCIDAGINSLVPADRFDLDGDDNSDEPLPFDLARHPRLANDPKQADTGSGTPPLVDIGAYEGWHRRGDINDDGHVNAADLLRLAASWDLLHNNDAFDPACDLHYDGRINVIDLLTLADDWGK